MRTTQRARRAGLAATTAATATAAPGPVAQGSTAGAAATRAQRAGDVITSVGDAQTQDTTALPQALAAAAHPGDKVTVTISRADQDRTVELTLGELPGS